MKIFLFDRLKRDEMTSKSHGHPVAGPIPNDCLAGYYCCLLLPNSILVFYYVLEGAVPSHSVYCIRVEILIPITVLNLRTGHFNNDFFLVYRKWNSNMYRKQGPGTFVVFVLYLSLFSLERLDWRQNYQPPLGTKRSQSRPLAMQNTLLIWLQETRTS